jgi:hypothetical protein
MGLPQLDPPWIGAPKRRKSNVDRIIQYDESKEVEIKIEGRVLHKLDLLLRGIVATPAEPEGTAKLHAPYPLISNARMEVNGVPVFNASGLALHVLQHLRRKKMVKADLLTTEEVNVGEVSVPFDARLVYDFVEPGTEPGHYGLQPTLLFPEGKVRLAVRFADGINAVVDAPAADTDVNDVFVDVGLGHVILETVSPIGYGAITAISSHHTPISSESEKKFELSRDCVAHWVVVLARQDGNELSDAVFDEVGKVRLTVGDTAVYEATVREARAQLRSLLPQGWPDYTGILALPLIRDEEAEGVTVQTQGQIFPKSLPAELQLPIVGHDENRVEICLVSRRDVDAWASAVGLV